MTKDINEKDLLILELVYELGSITEVARRCELSVGHVRKVVARNRSVLADMAETEISLLAPKAVSTLRNAMDEDGTTPKGEIRLNAAKEAFDRIGVGAKYREVEQTAATPVILMPVKQVQQEAIVVEKKEQ